MSKVFKKISSALILSTMLVTGAMATYPEGLEKESRKKAHSFLQQTEDPYVRKADKWQADFNHAWRYGYKGKTIDMWAEYVKLIAEDGQTEAATWFLTTGGKYGFVDRPYLPGEEELMDTAIRKVSSSIFEQQKRGNNSWLTTAKDFKSQAAATFGYLTRIEKMVDDLQKQVTGLTGRVATLESLLEKEKAEREKETSGLKSLLKQENEERKAESKSLKVRADLAEEKAEKERSERIAAVKAAEDKIAEEKHQRLLSEQNFKAELDQKAKEQADATLALHKLMASELEKLREKLESKAEATKATEISSIKAEFKTVQDMLQNMMANAEKEAKERAEEAKKEAKERAEEAKERAEAAEKRHKEEMERITAEAKAQREADEKRYKRLDRKNAYLMKTIVDQLQKTNRSKTHNSFSNSNGSSPRSSSFSSKHSKTHKEKAVTQTNIDNVFNIPSRNLSSSPKNPNKSPKKGLNYPEPFHLSGVKTIPSSIVSVKS